MKAKWILVVGVVCLAGCEYDPATGKVGRPSTVRAPYWEKRDCRDGQLDRLVDSAWRVFGPPDVTIGLPDADSPQRHGDTEGK